jgi:hypothetical protein
MYMRDVDSCSIVGLLYFFGRRADDATLAAVEARIHR